MKSVYGFIAVGLVIMMFGGIMAGVQAFRGSDFTEPHIITTVAETEEDITLAADVMDDNNTNIVITSTEATDAPIPFTLTNRVLHVHGLAENKTRTLTITYPVVKLDAFSNTASKFIPAYLIIGILIIIGGIAVSAFRRDGD